MGVIKTKGLILSQYNLNDNDRMVTLLTPNLGKIGCAAIGSRKGKSPLMAGTQFLCFGDFIVYKGISSYRINSCEPIEIFYNIRLDIDKLNYAVRVTKIINDVTGENDNSYRVLQLALNTLYVIANVEIDLDFVMSIFKFRLLSIIGFKPDLKHLCSVCNKNISKYFSIMDDCLKCADCAILDKSAIQVTESTIKSLYYIINCDPKKLYSFKVSDESKAEIKLISKLYFNRCMEKEYE